MKMRKNLSSAIKVYLQGLSKYFVNVERSISCREKCHLLLLANLLRFHAKTTTRDPQKTPYQKKVAQEAQIFKNYFISQNLYLISPPYLDFTK